MLPFWQTYRSQLDIHLLCNWRGKNKTIIIFLYLTKKETWQFLFFCHFFGFEISNIWINIYCFCICASNTWTFKILYMLQKHVFACFACVQSCIGSFACKLIFRHSTLIAEVNSSICFNFCITITMLYLNTIRGILTLWFFAPMLASTNALDVRS